MAKQSMTVTDLRTLVTDFYAQQDANPDDFVIVLDEEGAESQIVSWDIVNGVIFLVAERLFEDED